MSSIFSKLYLISVASRGIITSYTSPTRSWSNSVLNVSSNSSAVSVLLACMADAMSVMV